MVDLTPNTSSSSRASHSFPYARTRSWVHIDWAGAVETEMKF